MSVFYKNAVLTYKLLFTVSHLVLHLGLCHMFQVIALGRQSPEP